MSAQWVAYSAVKGFLKWKYGAQHPALRLKIKQQVIVKGGQWSWRAFSDYTAIWISSWLADRSSLANGGADEVFVGVGGNTP